jgi:hypothetical protein
MHKQEDDDEGGAQSKKSNRNSPEALETMGLGKAKNSMTREVSMDLDDTGRPSVLWNTGMH